MRCFWGLAFLRRSHTRGPTTSGPSNLTSFAAITFYFVHPIDANTVPHQHGLAAMRLTADLNGQERMPSGGVVVDLILSLSIFRASSLPEPITRSLRVVFHLVRCYGAQFTARVISCRLEGPKRPQFQRTSEEAVHFEDPTRWFLNSEVFNYEIPAFHWRCVFPPFH